MDLIVIGAGASGLMAAITAAQNGSRVTVLEHKDKAGKKILATGNGRCNFTNQNMTSDYFYGNKNLVEYGLSVFNAKDSIDFFNKLGVVCKNKNGYYYPNSNQANTILTALLDEVSRLGITLVTECNILSINNRNNTFKLHTNKGNFKADRLIVSVGLLAAPKLGSDGSLFSLLKSFGHHFNPIVPALCGFKCKNLSFKRVSGVRADAKVTALINDKVLAEDIGELQLTDYGISGIPVFQISRNLSKGLYNKDKVQVVIDFMPEYELESLANLITSIVAEYSRSKSWESLLSGLLNSKLSNELLVKAGINPTDIVYSGKKVGAQIHALCSLIKSLAVDVIEYRDFEFAQVCAGGIKSEEINTKTLESLIVPGLYFAGEILDVDGICGGYNLQWAWTSGYIAGLNASK